MTKHGYRSKYDVSKLVSGQQTFSGVELVAASCTSSPSPTGTIQLTTDSGVTNEWSEMLQAPTNRQDNYDRYDLTEFFDKIRQRLSARNLRHRFTTKYSFV